MAVYTEVGLLQAQTLLTRLGLGHVTLLAPVASGIENTNYFVSTADGEWVLTLFERLSAEQLPFYLGLMQHLARHGLPVPMPLADRHGSLVYGVAGKPAALVNRLAGEALDAPDLHHCAQLGHTLARMHLAVADFPLQQPNLRGLPWWEATAPGLRSCLDETTRGLLDAELDFQRHLAASATANCLPRGAVHADLFRDNALFEGLPGRERLSGVFDFYFAGLDSYAYDLAVVLNDWCIDLVSGQLVPERAAALMQAYQAERPLRGRRVTPVAGLASGCGLALLAVASGRLACAARGRAVEPQGPHPL